MVAKKRRDWVADYRAKLFQDVHGMPLPEAPQPTRAPRVRSSRPPVLTHRQEAFLVAVGALATELGRLPSAGEIATKLGMKRQSALEMLRLLEERGLVRDVPKLVTGVQWELTEKVAARR